MSVHLRSKIGRSRNAVRLSRYELSLCAKLLSGFVLDIMSNPDVVSDDVARQSLSSWISKDVPNTQNLRNMFKKRLRNERDMGIWVLEYHNRIQKELGRKPISHDILVRREVKPSCIPYFNDVEVLKRSRIQPR